MRVSINILERNGNASKTALAMAKGIARCGDAAVVRNCREHQMLGFDAAVLWGYVTECQKIIQNCKNQGIPFVFIDLGYWRRDSGYFKIAVNDRHPTQYLMKQNLPDDRFKKLDLPIKPWCKVDGYILLAGMSGKAAWAWNIPGNETYEKHTATTLQRLTKRPIVYRPKPNWNEAHAIPGTRFDKKTPVERALAQAHCVVTHHSNVGCDALLEGVPVFSKYGAASVLGPYNLENVEKPYYPENREQWAANLCYSQWTIHEMMSGECWQHLKSVRLIG